MKVRSGLLLGLLLAVTAAACGDGEALFPRSGTEAATTTTMPSYLPTTSTTSPGSGGTVSGVFPDQVVERYLEGCTEDGDPDFCFCTIEELQRRLTLDEFLELANEGSFEQSPVILEVTDVCLAQTGGPPSTTSTTEPPRELTIDELAQLTIVDLEEYWATQLDVAYGVAYEPIEETIPYFPSTGDLPRCGPDTLPPDIAADNAFYCQPGDYIAWDAEGLIPDLYNEFGDFAISLVLAHEWGHAIQARARVQGPTILTELQADCFAGAWTGAVDEGNRNLALEPGDLEEAMAGYLLFRDPVGTRPRDPGAHGTAFDRVNAFQDGFFNGIDACVRYEEGDFEVIDIPLTAADFQSGGDLPFDDVEPLLTTSLEIFWELTFPELFGSPWQPVAEFGPYLPSTELLPACGDEQPDPADYVDNAFYCEEDDFVAWDGENLFPDLYQSIGDFALGMVLGHEWGTAVQARAGLPTQGLQAELQADCFTGAWSAAMVPFDNPTEIVLSAGDLDEAISGFLAFSEGPDDVAMSGTAFQRFDAFKNGFFSGAPGCLLE